jgi:predicted DNA-binding protein
MSQQEEKIRIHLEGMEMERAYLLENLGDYHRIQRKNVQEYLSGRIETLMNDIEDVSFAESVIEKDIPIAKKKTG